MKIKPEALDIIADRRLSERVDNERFRNDQKNADAERRDELVSWLLSTERGRELWYMFIANAPALKQNAMTGNAQSYFILGVQSAARQLLEYSKEYHFDKWLLMEQEAYKRKTERERTEAEHGNT